MTGAFSVMDLRTGSIAALAVALIAASMVAITTVAADDLPARGPGHTHGLTMPPLDLEQAAIAEAKEDPTGQTGSGGRAVVHRAGGRLVTEPALVRRAPDARLHRTGFATFEPTMGITKKGTIFANAIDLDLNEPSIIRSMDDGRTWKNVFANHRISLDPYMYVDPDTSRVFANDLSPQPNCHFISVSDDEGKTWATNPPAGCGHNADHQTIFAGPPPEGGSEPSDYPNIVYLCSIGVGVSVASAGSVCSKSLDGGTTFLPTGEPAFVDDPRQSGDFGLPGVCNGANGHGWVGEDGTVFLPRGWCGQPWLAISKNEGQSWTRVQVSDIGMPCCGKLNGQDSELFTHEAGVVTDNAGTIYYTWVAADRLPYLVVSRDGGVTWSKPLMIGPPGLEEALLPGMTIGARGKIAVHYMGSEDSAWDGDEVKGSYDDTTWNAYVTMTVDVLKSNPTFYSATINDPSEPLWQGECGPDPARCGWGDFFDVVVHPDGTPWAVAVDLCTNEGCGGSGEAILGHLVGGPSLR